MPGVPCACTEGTPGMTLTSEANEEREAFRVSARRERTSEANEEREAFRVSARRERTSEANEERCSSG